MLMNLKRALDDANDNNDDDNDDDDDTDDDDDEYKHLMVELKAVCALAGRALLGGGALQLTALRDVASSADGCKGRGQLPMLWHGM